MAETTTSERLQLVRDAIDARMRGESVYIYDIMDGGSLGGMKRKVQGDTLEELIALEKYLAGKLHEEQVAARLSSTGRGFRLRGPRGY